MPVEVDTAISVYREYSRIPTIGNAYISNSETPGHIRVNSEWTLRDIERSTKVKFSRHHIAQLNQVFLTFPTDISNEVLRRESPSGRYCAVLRKAKDKKSEDKQYIEIWDDTNKIQNIDVSVLEQHGKVYEDDQFGMFEWSQSETHLLYVAEKKRPEAKSYFEKSTKASSSCPHDSTKGDEYVYVDDWGEQLTGKSSSVLCVLDVEAGSTSTLDNLPNDVFPGQAVWCEDDAGVVCVGWYPEPFRLGIIYCPMRRSSLFYIDLKSSTYMILGSTKHSVRSPRFSPDFTKLVWLQNPAAGPHFQCAQLVMCDWSNKGIVTVLDIVRKAEVTEFQGLSLQSLPRRCWSRDNRRLILSTHSRSLVKAVVVDTVVGTVTPLPSGGAGSNVGCLVVKDVHRDLIIASCSSPNQPNFLVVGQLPGAGKEESISWTHLDTEPPRFLDFTWRIINMTPPADQVNSKYGPMAYDAILLEPTLQVAGTKPPLVVYPHEIKALYMSAKLTVEVETAALQGRTPRHHLHDPDEEQRHHPFSPTHYDPSNMEFEMVVLDSDVSMGMEGGPHTVFPADFMLYPAGLCKLGYTVLLVNYRGSSGYGQDSIDSLPGNVGTQDVKDCQHAVQTVLEMEAADPDDVYAIGGSHGGFITAHLIGQYPDFYKAACCRNPVINMATMLGATDIADWNYTEGGLVFDHTQTGHGAVYDEMWKRSPIRYVDQIRTPTMIMLGEADRRVPPQQGRELWKALRARNVPVRMHVYPGNAHPIDGVDAESDAFINIYTWFKSRGQPV